MANEKQPVTRLAVRFPADDGPTRTYINNGLSIRQGDEDLVITERSLPEGFPYSLDELRSQLKKVRGMEVKTDA